MIIQDILQTQYRGNKSACALGLGISKNTLYKYLKDSDNHLILWRNDEYEFFAKLSNDRLSGR